MVICATDGYIVVVFGPYAAKDNDATIFRDILEHEKDPKNGDFYLIEALEMLLLN